MGCWLVEEGPGWELSRLDTGVAEGRTSLQPWRRYRPQKDSRKHHSRESLSENVSLRGRRCKRFALVALAALARRGKFEVAASVEVGDQEVEYRTVRDVRLD